MMRKRTASTNPSSPDCSDDDSVPASHPDENDSIRRFFTASNLDTGHPLRCDFVFRLAPQFKEGKNLWVQILTIYAAAVLTYGYTNIDAEGMRTNVQIAIMTVIALVGASPFSSTHLVTATIGAFTGGHNILGSVASMEDVVKVTWVNYFWLFLLSLVVALIWRFFIDSKWKVLDGFAGRLGTTAFLGMNAAMLAYGPFGVVSWDRYYYGLATALNSAEDSIPLARAWIEEAELAIGYVLAVGFLGVVGGGTRVMHNNYIKKLEEGNKESMPKQVPPVRVLNNIIVPVLWALLGMLIVVVSEYENAPALFNGFAVGSYVAMASLQRISSITKFAIVSAVAAGWGLVLTPFFVGFPGKSGFTAMLGHATCCLFETAQDKLRSRRESREPHEMLNSPSDGIAYPETISLQRHARQEAPESPRTDHYYKPKTENSVITKHQRRQQKKLKHLHLQNSPLGDEDAGDPPKLHHRAWSAVKAEADEGAWHHSLKSRQEWNSLV